MTDVGFDTYRLSYAEKTGGHYAGVKNELPNIGNPNTCKSYCISTIGCTNWWYDSNGKCYISSEPAGNFISTPSSPNDTSGKIANSILPNAGMIAFWALISFFFLLLIFWLFTSKNGVMALTGKIAYYHGGKFNTFQKLDARVI